MKKNLRKQIEEILGDNFTALANNKMIMTKKIRTNDDLLYRVVSSSILSLISKEVLKCLPKRRKENTEKKAFDNYDIVDELNMGYNQAIKDMRKKLRLNKED